MREGEQDRDEIHQRQKGEGIAHEGPGRVILQFIVRGHEPQQIVQDENARAAFVQRGEKRRLRLEGQRHKAHDDERHHDRVIGGAHPVAAAGGLDDLKQAFSHYGLQRLQGS